MASVKITLTVLLLKLALLASSASFSAPILAPNIPTVAASRKRHLPRSTRWEDESENQKYLDHAINRLSDPHDHTTLTVTGIGDYMPVTSIGIGTPPQNINVAIDTCWSALFVPSSNCTGDCSSHASYNRSKSHTSLRNETFSEINYWNILGLGTVQRETVMVGQLEITSQPFVELSNFYHFPNPAYPARQIIDGVLGLAPSNFPTSSDPSLSPDLTGPFMSMIDQNLLDRNLFALKLGRNQTESGEVSFGAVNEALFTGPMQRLPLSRRKSRSSGLPGCWSIDADLVRLGESLSMSYENVSATLVSTFPALSIPIIAPEILRAIGGESHPSDPYGPKFIDCAIRPSLPHLTLILSGREFTLSAFDYTTEVFYEGRGLQCQVAIIGDFGDSTMILGIPFMRSFYHVFDFDAQEVGLAALAG